MRSRIFPKYILAPVLILLASGILPAAPKSTPAQSILSAPAQSKTNAPAQSHPNAPSKPSQNAATALSSPTSLTFDFTQTKSSEMLEKDIVSQGKMAYIAPDKLRWEYTTPYKSLFIMNGDKVLTRNSAGEKQSKAKAGSLYARISKLMTGLVSAGAHSACSSEGAAAENLKTAPSIKAEGFDCTAEECGDGLHLKLIPFEQSAKRLFREVRVLLDKKTGVATKIEIEEKNGDRTTIVCRNIKLNPEIDAALFEF